MGRDTGDSPAWENLAVTHADDYDTLPMAYEGEVSIPSSDETVTLPTVEVQRVVAKVSYEIAVESADIELRSVQLLSVPRAVSVLDVAARPVTIRIAWKQNFRDSRFRETAICFRICRARFRPLPTSAIRIRTTPPRMLRIF